MDPRVSGTDAVFLLVLPLFPYMSGVCLEGIQGSIISDPACAGEPTFPCGFLDFSGSGGGADSSQGLLCVYIAVMMGALNYLV